MLPVTVIALVQVLAILVVLGEVAGRPAQVPLLIVAILATLAMMVGLALATAGLTNSPEHAQVTTLPVSLGVIAVASWVGITGTEELTLLKRLLPGGAATELVVDAWDGGVRPRRLAPPAGPHAGLGRRGCRPGRPPVPLGATPMSAPHRA